jgi:hypothetical protein
MSRRPATADFRRAVTPAESEGCSSWTISTGIWWPGAAAMRTGPGPICRWRRCGRWLVAGRCVGGAGRGGGLCHGAGRRGGSAGGQEALAAVSAFRILTLCPRTRESLRGHSSGSGDSGGRRPASSISGRWSGSTGTATLPTWSRAWSPGSMTGRRRVGRGRRLCWMRRQICLSAFASRRWITSNTSRCRFSPSARGAHRRVDAAHDRAHRGVGRHRPALVFGGVGDDPVHRRRGRAGRTRAPDDRMAQLVGQPPRALIGESGQGRPGEPVDPIVGLRHPRPPVLPVSAAPHHHPREDQDLT